MTAHQLFEKLLDIQKEFGTLNVPISVWKQDDDRYEISEIDIITDYDVKNEKLHSIDININ